RLAVAPSVLALCASAAKGSVRQALVTLATCRDADPKTARQLLREPTVREAKTDKVDEVVTLARQGLTRGEIAQALNVERTTVWRWLQKAVEAGAITAKEIRRG